MSLAREGVRHAIIAQREVSRAIARQHVEELGSCFYDPAARHVVASVDTLDRRFDQYVDWGRSVSLWITDEAHHVLRENKWGRALELFPQARGLGVTATAVRADGKGLGRHADGVFDKIVDGPSMRNLISQGYLCSFKIFVPPPSVDMSGVAIGATGDYVHKQMVAAVRKSRLVGDVVEHYLKRAPGKIGLTFVPDVATAHETAQAFIRAGVPAAAISAKTPGPERRHCMRQLRAGKLLNIVNVDLFGEGVDVPEIEVVSMARPTMSYPLYVQQFGRMGRVLTGKSFGILLDHVDNVRRHYGPPDKGQHWSLDRRPSRRSGSRDPDLIPQKICSDCTQPYEAYMDVCPHCAAPYEPARRDGPEHVDGDLIELDRATLDAMQHAIAQVDRTPDAIYQGLMHSGATHAAAGGAAKNQRARINAQNSLRRLVSLYGGLNRSRGRSDREGHKRFYFRYGIDVMSAQALGRPDAENLACRLISDLGNGRV